MSSAAPQRFSPGRVLSAVLLVLVAAGTFAAIWFIPWPVALKKPAPTLPIRERIERMKQIAEREAAEKRVDRERESGDRP